MKKERRRLKPLLMVMLMDREKRMKSRGVAVRRQIVTMKRKQRRVRLVLRREVMEVCFIPLQFGNTPGLK